METGLYVLGLLAAALGIAASIALHEVGHLLPAKRFGVKVTQYMIGFGPTIFSRRRGETQYGVKAIPLGGYIRMVGMYPPPKGAPAGTAGRGTTGRFQVLAEEARAAAWEEVSPGDEDRLFYRLSAPRKVVVMLGGPTMNLLIAAGVFTLLLVGIGLPTPSTTVASVLPCVPPAMATEQAARDALADPAAARADAGCTDTAPRSPAAAAGVVAGDRIEAVDGQPVATWEALTGFTRSSAGTTVTLQLADDGSGAGGRSVEAALALVYRPELDAQGAPTGQVVSGGFLGITPSTEYVAQPVSAVPTTMWDLAVRSGQALLALPARVVQLAQDLITGAPRDPEGPISVVGISRISGEVVAAPDPVMQKIVLLLSLLASLNLFLFLFNLIPLLPLDGGHVAGAVWEGTRRQIARARSRPDPGPVDVARMLPVAYAVGIVLIAVSAVVILADIVAPISIAG